MVKRNVFIIIPNLKFDESAELAIFRLQRYDKRAKHANFRINKTLTTRQKHEMGAVFEKLLMFC